MWRSDEPDKCSIQAAEVQLTQLTLYGKAYITMNQIRLLLILLAALWCGALITARMLISETSAYDFLSWNLGLASLPLIVSSLMNRLKVWHAALLFPAWLLLLPNAPYVLTDLFHLKPKSQIPLWYDLILLLSCGGLSFFMGLISMRQVHDIVARTLGAVSGWIMVLFSVFATGFGIYLGRYLRWNSWDVVTNPLPLFSDIVTRLLHPARHLEVYGVTFGFGALLILAYALFFSSAGNASSASLARGPQSH
jgi:uncharacterized membrane protein